MTQGGANLDTQGLLNAVFDPTNQALRMSAAPPSGAAGGDLAGTYPNPTVVQLTGATNTVTVVDATNLAVGSSTGTKIGTASTQKLGFWNRTPIVQPARAGQLTDNSGGTSGGNTIAAVTDNASAANAVATLAAKVNALEAMLHNLGLEA